MLGIALGGVVMLAVTDTADPVLTGIGFGKDTVQLPPVIASALQLALTDPT